MLVPALLSVLEMMPLPEPPAREAQRWQTVITEEGITCRIAPADGMRVSWGEAIGEVPSPLAQIVSHLLDFEGARKYIPRATDVRILERSMGQALVYYRIGLPWPISDRDWVVRYRYAAHGESGFEMSWSERNDVGPRSDETVRVQLARGVWQLTSTGNKTTLVRYLMLSDLGGRLPISIVSQTAWRQPLETIKGVRKALRSVPGTQPHQEPGNSTPPTAAR